MDHHWQFNLHIAKHDYRSGEGEWPDRRGQSCRRVRFDGKAGSQPVLREAFIYISKIARDAMTRSHYLTRFGADIVPKLNPAD